MAIDDALSKFRKSAVKVQGEPVGEPPVASKPPTTPPPAKEPVISKPPSQETPSTHQSPPPDVLSASEARKYAEKKAAELGIPFPSLPKVMPSGIDLPEDITVIQSDELGRLLSKYVAVCAYLEPQVALLSVDAHCAEQTLDYIRNKTLLSPVVQDTYDKAAEKKALCDTQMPVVRLQAQVSKVRAEYDTVGALLRAYEKCANTVSREITRRASIMHIEGSGRIA